MWNSVAWHLGWRWWGMTGFCLYRHSPARCVNRPDGRGITNTAFGVPPALSATIAAGEGSTSPCRSAINRLPILLFSMGRPSTDTCTGRICLATRASLHCAYAPFCPDAHYAWFTTRHGRSPSCCVAYCPVSYLGGSRFCLRRSPRQCRTLACCSGAALCNSCQHLPATTAHLPKRRNNDKPV